MRIWNLLRTFCLGLMISLYGMSAFAVETVVAQPKIINGTTAITAQVPWQAALISEDAQGGLTYFCSATLIDAQWVVTAAHCLADMSTSTKLHVLLGQNDLSHYATGQWMTAKQWIINPGFNNHVNLENDIALVQLSTPVDFTACGNKCQIIPYLTPANDQQYAAVGAQGQIAGWGEAVNCNVTNCSAWQAQPFGTPLAPSQLQVAQFKTVACPNTSYSYAGQNWQLSDNEVCAVGASATNPADTCQGDSGSGLVMNIGNGTPYLAAITSWGSASGCGASDFPGVYTHVAHYSDWVTSVVNPSAASSSTTVAATSNPTQPASSSGGHGGGGATSPFMLLALGGLWLARRRLVVTE